MTCENNGACYSLWLPCSQDPFSPFLGPALCPRRLGPLRTPPTRLPVVAFDQGDSGNWARQAKPQRYKTAGGLDSHTWPCSVHPESEAISSGDRAVHSLPPAPYFPLQDTPPGRQLPGITCPSSPEYENAPLLFLVSGAPTSFDGTLNLTHTFISRPFVKASWAIWVRVVSYKDSGLASALNNSIKKRVILVVYFT